MDQRASAGDLHVDDNGTGEAIVLLHAFPLDGRIWTPLASALSASYRVLTPDLRGFGRSHDARPPSSIDQHADDVAAVLGARGIASATVVGLSMGGYVALALAKRHPQLVARLGLVDARAEGDSPETSAARELNIAMVDERGVPELVERMLPKLLAPGATDDVRRAVHSIGAEQTRASVRAALLAMRDRADATSVLASIGVPTAVIVGEEDALLSVAEAQRMVATTPRAVLDVIEKAGHLSPCEAPAAFARAVARLLERPSDFTR